MKKIVVIILLSVIIIGGIAGCRKNANSATINITVKDTTNSVEDNVGKILTYSL